MKIQLPDGFGSGCFGIVLAGIIVVPMLVYVIKLVV